MLTTQGTSERSKETIGTMTRIYTTIKIKGPISEVFNYVTTPVSWLQWHPSCQGVSGATEHSLEVGEQVTEEFVVAGRSGSARITYTLTEQEGGTVFERELVYSLSKPWLVLLDWLVLRHRVNGESTEALRRLKAVLEGG